MPDARQISRELEIAGGAYVLRGCCGKNPGDVVSRDELLAMNPANAIALIKQERIRTWPASPDAMALLTRETKRFAIHRGCGKYDVIEGVQLNTEQLSKEEAEALAGTTESTPPN